MRVDIIIHTHASPEYLAHSEGIMESAYEKCIERHTAQRNFNRAQFCTVNY